MSGFTDNIAEFGARERKIMDTLIQAWRSQGLPRDFADVNVRPAMNKDSGWVFLVNDDYVIAMMNGDRLERVYLMDITGEEGFIGDLLTRLNPAELRAEELEDLLDLIKTHDLAGNDLPPAWRLVVEKVT